MGKGRRRPAKGFVHQEVFGGWYLPLLTADISVNVINRKQESPAIADKPARRESLPKIASIRRLQRCRRDLGVNGKPIYDFVLVINSNFSRICYRFRDIHG